MEEDEPVVSLAIVAIGQASSFVPSIPSIAEGAILEEMVP